MHDVLFTPWRSAYITGQTRREPGCFFCAAALDSDDPERLVVYRTAHHLVMLNLHPYNTGHLMIAPLEHLDVPEAACAEAVAELWPLATVVRQVLQEVYRPEGFNLGINLGRIAGAGVPDHFHLHVVPRWTGDANFMGVVGGTRLVPEDLHVSWQKLRDRFSATR